MTKIEEALKSLGLNEKQTAVYVSLLQLGKATAYKIAQNSGLKRPTVYVVLDELRLKGLVLKIPYPKKQIYSARNPEELVEGAKDNLSRITRILPELLALTREEKRPSALYFEGLRGVKELLDYGIDKSENGELVGFNAHAEGVSEEITKIFSEYNDKLKRKNVRIRSIVPDHPSMKKYREEDEKFSRSVKVIPFEEYSSDVSIDIGPDFVRILMFKDLQGIVIEHKGLASAIKQIFEMQWESL